VKETSNPLFLLWVINFKSSSEKALKTPNSILQTK